MKTLLAASALVLAACASRQTFSDRPFASWQTGHPMAALQLCAFGRNYPSDARRVQQWLRAHPAQASMLLDWVAANPRGPIPAAMFRTRASGREQYAPWQDPAMFALLGWAADNPEAAEDLAATPRGLEFAIDGTSC